MPLASANSRAVEPTHWASRPRSASVTTGPSGPHGGRSVQEPAAVESCPNVWFDPCCGRAKQDSEGPFLAMSRRQKSANAEPGQVKRPVVVRQCRMPVAERTAAQGTGSRTRLVPSSGDASQIAIRTLKCRSPVCMAAALSSATRIIGDTSNITVEVVLCHLRSIGRSSASSF
jgi:hypothetical protein